MRIRMIGGLALMLAAIVIAGMTQRGGVRAQDAADSPPSLDEQEKRQEFMRGKLAGAHKIIDGLATEDFEMIEEGAAELIKIADSAAWEIPNDVYYRYYSANFEQAARGLVEAAQKKNLEKATFAYVHVTISCTACHQHVRNVFRVAEQGTHQIRR